MAKESGIKIIAENRAARHEYFDLETYEAGIELFGTEVKSIRGGKVNLKDSYAHVDRGELFVYGMHISPYEQGNIFNRDPLRPKKLLMHKRRSFRCRFIFPDRVLKYLSAFAKAKSCMTSGMTRQSDRQAATWIAP